MTLPFLTWDSLRGRIGWAEMVQALARGHALPPARIDDSFLTRGSDTLLTRAAWIDGLGMGLKTVTVMAGNAARGLDTVQGVMVVFDEATGAPAALLDSSLVTWWKTAADSGLGARLLARPDSERLLIVGSGRVAESLAQVYTALFPGLRQIAIWSRRSANSAALAARLADQGIAAEVAEDLETAVAGADIITSATMASDPILRGAWVSPGTHVDLIGAFRADMREADDALLRRGRLFVDSRATTLEHIGELLSPLRSGVITPEDVLGDLYDLQAGQAGRRNPDEITIFKNGGGAHLDLMIARAIIDITAGG